MKIKFAFSAGLMLAAGLGLAFAGETVPAVAARAAVEDDAKVKEFKDILFKLVRQDEFLDEAIEILDTGSGRPSTEDLAALGVSLNSVSKSLRGVSALNKAEFSRVQPGSGLSRYTNTILSYSRKLARKSSEVSALVKKLSEGAKKAAMRDAVTSGKGAGKTGGKNLTQVLAEQKAGQRALAGLAADAAALREAARDLNASSKWLHIASN